MDRYYARHGDNASTAQTCMFLLANIYQYAIIMSMKKISVMLTEQQIATLHQIAQETGIRFGELLRRLLDKALKEEKQARR